MGTIRFIKLNGDDDGEVIRELPWFEDPSDKDALKRALTEESSDGLSWKDQATGVLAARAVDDNGNLGARYSWWDYDRDRQAVARERREKARKEQE